MTLQHGRIRIAPARRKGNQRWHAVDRHTGSAGDMVEGGSLSRF